MRIIALSTLKAFWKAHDDAEQPLLAWHALVKRADWASPPEVKATFGSASVLRDGRVVFYIAGNKYRLAVWINYPYRVVYVRFIGTHAEYDQIDVQTI
jgi:mRNA interferase HigB